MIAAITGFTAPSCEHSQKKFCPQNFFIEQLQHNIAVFNDDVMTV
jgi:hypothetical protein